MLFVCVLYLKVVTAIQVLCQVLEMKLAAIMEAETTIVSAIYNKDKKHA